MRADIVVVVDEVDEPAAGVAPGFPTNTRASGMRTEVFPVEFVAYTVT